MLSRRWMRSAFSMMLFTALVALVSERLLAEPVAQSEGTGGFVEPQHPHEHHLGGWYLGVFGNYTPTGLYLTQVYPRTAAANAGLEVGDRIVAVNGRRISMRFPLDVALQSTRTGWVRLLIQDRRTNQLIHVDVRLTRRRIYT